MFKYYLVCLRLEELTKNINAFVPVNDCPGLLQKHPQITCITHSTDKLSYSVSETGLTPGYVQADRILAIRVLHSF